MHFTFSCQQKLGPHANVGFSKAMSAGWLQVDKTAEGGPRVMRKVRSTQYVPGKNVYSRILIFRTSKGMKIGSKLWIDQEIESEITMLD